MKILVTNDDGISSPALVKLAAWARRLGEVTVVAPLCEQSGKSQSIDFRNPMKIKKMSADDASEIWAVDSTPADCVRFGVIGLGEEYDLVISGINRGYNLGDDISYSGTVGAIFEASRVGIKAIALSTGVESFDNAFCELDGVYEYILQKNLFEHAELLNVNIPISRSKGIAITRQGKTFYSDRFVKCDGEDMYVQAGEPIYNADTDLSVDVNAIRQGYVSITPLTAKKTDLAVYEKIKAL